MKPEDQKLQLAICPHCGAKFFFPKPDVAKKIVRVETYKQMPDRAGILTFECRRCKQPQFIEIIYES